MALFSPDIVGVSPPSALSRNRSPFLGVLALMELHSGQTLPGRPNVGHST
jgi:hypothetical protein